MQRNSDRSPFTRWRNSKDQEGLPCTKTIGSPAPSSMKCISWPEEVVKNLLSKGNISSDTQSGRMDGALWITADNPRSRSCSPFDRMAVSRWEARPSLPIRGPSAPTTAPYTVTPPGYNNGTRSVLPTHTPFPSSPPPLAVIPVKTGIVGASLVGAWRGTGRGTRSHPHARHPPTPLRHPPLDQSTQPTPS